MCITDLLKDIVKSEVNEDSIIELSKKINYILGENVWRNIINENIHSSHRMYQKSVYDNKINSFSEFLDTLDKILECIDFSKFIDINEDIKIKLLALILIPQFY